MKKLKRILDLIKKTGDRYIFDDNQGNSFVILNINDYENLVLKNSPVKNLSEDELLNKINKDIAVWKAVQTEEKEEQLAGNFANFKQANEADSVGDDQYYFEPVEDEE
jgi:accessory colonization factor AcfC